LAVAVLVAAVDSVGSVAEVDLVGVVEGRAGDVEWILTIRGAGRAFRFQFFR
jgi:hypothetical protein